MRLSDFDYDLPPERIAQEPASERDGSRLMVLDRDGALLHRRFADLPEFLEERDLVVLNDTRVIPARLRGRKPSGGALEVLLDRPEESETAHNGRFLSRWRCLMQAARPLRAGGAAELPQTGRLRVIERTAGGLCRVELDLPRPWPDYLESCGEVPLPAYIRRDPADPRFSVDRERYQTVFARQAGAVAAPTAGLHFTPRLLERIERKGVRTARITLHVGPGTFLPVRTEEVERHRMLAERFQVPADTAAAIRACRDRGGRVVAVGTTVVRALESAARDGEVRAGEGETDLFIRPGHRFAAVDALVTNFHLPRSTLLLLVCAFAGRERILAAYAEAVRLGYRFYSYGDAVFIAGRAAP